MKPTDRKSYKNLGIKNIRVSIKETTRTMTINKHFYSQWSIKWFN